ncbi:NifB/NifX family molybdenum-iron cluster-binding protein [bacterium]|nr:NifB/NifX family molybdenum-iron cluster-binding protein [bacterium]
MKIVITATKDSLDSEVESRFGRAPFFAIYETDNDKAEFVNNEQNLNATSGAGIQAAQNVIAAGAKVIITGNCGPKAFKTLNAAGIKVITGATRTVKEAAEKFKNGEFTYTDSANVEGHWM